MSLPSLRIAVVGMGGIGSTIAFYLVRIGHHDVSVVARPGSPRLRQLQHDNGIVAVDGTRAEVSVADTLDEQTVYDLVVVTLLAHQVDAVLPALQRSAAKCVLFMFNNFNPERLRDVLGAERCCFAMPFLQATIDANGKLRARVGAAGQKTKIDQPRWVNLFTAAGLPATLEPHMLLWLRCHVPLCVGFESISVAGVRRGGGASWGEALVIGRGMQASFALIQRLGYQLYPTAKSWLRRSPAWVVAGMLWSLSRVATFRELLATGLGECGALVDVMLAAAAKDGFAQAAAIRAMKPAQQAAGADEPRGGT